MFTLVQEARLLRDVLPVHSESAVPPSAGLRAPSSTAPKADLRRQVAVAFTATPLAPTPFGPPLVTHGNGAGPGP